MEERNISWTPEIEEQKKLYEQFQQEFPIERLKTLTLEEYNNTKREDSFCYWIESKLKSIGSIQGATSYKFGIYEYKNKPRTDNGYSHDDKYAWLSKYGENPIEAFENIRSNLVMIAKCAKSGDMNSIDNIDLTNMFKWKIAFLYSDCKFLNIFSEDSIRLLSKKYGLKNSDKATFSQMYKFLLSLKKEDEDVFAFAPKIWNEWLEYKNNEENNSNIIKNSTQMKREKIADYVTLLKNTRNLILT